MAPKALYKSKPRAHHVAGTDVIIHSFIPRSTLVHEQKTPCPSGIPRSRSASVPQTVRVQMLARLRVTSDTQISSPYFYTRTLPRQISILQLPHFTTLLISQYKNVAATENLATEIATYAETHDPPGLCRSPCAKSSVTKAYVIGSQPSCVLAAPRNCAPSLRLQGSHNSKTARKWNNSSGRGLCQVCQGIGPIRL